VCESMRACVRMFARVFLCV